MTSLKTKKAEPFQVINAIVLLMVSVVTIYPFWNILVISLSDYKTYLDYPVQFLPLRPTLENYAALLSDSGVVRSLAVSGAVTAGGVLYNMFLTVTMAYGLSKQNYAGRKLFWAVALIPMFFSGGLVPTYVLVANWLRLRNSILSMILPLGINLWYLIIIKNFFSGIPQSLHESARIDGANELRVLGAIVLPMSMPVLVTFVLFYGVDRWNEWFNCMLYINDSKLYTLQYMLREMVVKASGQRSMEYSFGSAHTFLAGIKMAGVVFAVLPILAVYPFLQKYFVTGVVLGAVKG